MFYVLPYPLINSLLFFRIKGENVEWLYSRKRTEKAICPTKEKCTVAGEGRMVISCPTLNLIEHY